MEITVNGFTHNQYTQIEQLANVYGKTVNDFLFDTISERLEMEEDYKIGIEALARFEKNPIIHSIDELIEELENEL